MHDPLRTVQIILPLSTHEQLKRLAEEDGEPVEKLVDRAINNYLHNRIPEWKQQ